TWGGADGGPGGQGYLSAQAGADGRFAARILPGSYLSLQLYPGGASADAGTYVTTAVPPQTWGVDTSATFTMVQGVQASGRVRLGDGETPSTASMRFYAPATGISTSVSVADGGTYAVLVAPGTYSVTLDYGTTGFWGSNVLVAQTVQVTGPTTVDATVADVT